jgi:UDP-2,4-diacetamido-2,4,6-trideoxy-beta-L-altropyranose hydrolase
MIRAAFRVDASLSLGTGHVMRCLTLAQEMKDSGAEILFISRTHTGHCCDLIEAQGFAVERLVPSSCEAQGMVGASAAAYVPDLGGSLAADAAATRRTIDEFGPLDWLVVDHYAVDVDWEKAVRSVTSRIMVIDDLADRCHDCDLLLDQNFHLKGESRYAEIVPAHCIRLLGPHYALLRREFLAARQRLHPRNDDVRRIVFGFGGTDSSNETAKAIRGFLSLGCSDIRADVVVGSTYPHFASLERLCAGEAQVAVHRQPRNGADLMAMADLAVGAGGSSTWERCCVGLPSIVVSVAENQEVVVRDLASAGFVSYIGKSEWLESRDIARALSSALRAPAMLKAQGERCLGLVDGLGACRVVEALEA